MTTNLNLFRSRLESERRRLIEELEQLKATIRQPKDQREGSPLERDEGARDIFELERYVALQARTTNGLAEVEHALHKFDSGTYGFCDCCGKAIDPARLGVLPGATLCVSCKTR